MTNIALANLCSLISEATMLSGPYFSASAFTSSVPICPLARACATALPQVADVSPAQAEPVPGRSALAALGMRSEAVVPLLDTRRAVLSVLALYSAWPGFFAEPRHREFLEQVQRSLGAALQRHAQRRVAAQPRRTQFGCLLREGRVRMLYQPIINLDDGRLLKVEALARLVDDGGALLSPALFLPALGEDDLLRLLELGARQVCADRRAWAALGLDLVVALNLPPQAMADRRFHEALFSTLRQCRADTRRMELEILESPAGDESCPRESFFATLHSLGMRVVEDDLGSGYSSLLRMESMPFDGVKIDQGLVLRAARNTPRRALEFVHHLTQLAHALRVHVTVEGLEHEGLIEACAILGADAGQGYAIARPMLPEALPAWAGAYVHRVDPQRPRSALGALALYMSWDRQLGALQRWPGLIEDFVGSLGTLRACMDAVARDKPELRRLFDANRAFALQGTRNRMYRRTREQLVGLLGNLWLESLA